MTTLRHYEVVKVSEREWHVLEQAFDEGSPKPYVLARCSAPTPANDIKRAMQLCQELQVRKESLLGHFSALTVIARKFDLVITGGGRI